MAAINPLASTLLMGLFLIVIVAAMARIRDWQREPATPGGGGNPIARVARQPATWAAVFVVLTLGFAVGALAIVGGLPISFSVGDSFWAVFTATFAPFAVLLAVLLFGGVYAAARYRGMASSMAVGLGASFVGVAFLAAVTVKLIVG